MFSKILPRSHSIFSNVVVGSRSIRSASTTVTSHGNIQVISLDHKLPLSGAAVIVNGGSSFEDSNTAGVSHFLEQGSYHGNAAPHTIFTTHLKYFSNAGSTFKATRSREKMTYSTIFPSDEDGHMALYALPGVASFKVHRWEFEPLVQVVQRIQAQISTKEQIADSLHAQAFRAQPLAWHLYPSWNVGKINSEVLDDFKSKTLQRSITVVGVNVSHQILEESIANDLSAKDKKASSETPRSKYVGGGEVRLFSSGSSVSVSVAFEGKSLADDAALTILSYVLGRKRATEFQKNRLSSLQSKSAGQIHAAYSFVKSYSDTGLFGVTAVGQTNTLAQVLVEEVKKLSELSDSEFQAAKNAAVVDFLAETETVSGLLHHLATRGTAVEQRVSSLEQVSLDQVKSAAKELLKSSPTVVGYGNVHNLAAL